MGCKWDAIKSKVSSAGASTEGDILAVEPRLDLSVEYEHEGTTCAAEYVGEGTLEEGTGALLSGDLSDAVHGASVLDIGTSAARLHHQSSANGVKRVGDDTSADGDDLGESEECDGACLLHVGEEDGFTSVEATEVRGTVGNDTDDGDTETLVETLGTISGSYFLEAVNETVELTSLAGADVSSESGTGEVERVDHTEGSGTSGTTGGAVTNEELYLLGLGIEGAEDLLVDILEGEVKGLSGEISDDVGSVSSPESSETLFVVDARKAITNTGVLLHVGGWGLASLGSLLAHGVLDLKEELDTLDGGDDGLGDGGGDTTDHEIGEEALVL
jgi:hypothetical protein